MALEFSNFVRKPFVIQAVEVTVDNIEEVAEFVGTLRKKENGDPYILVDRKLVPSVFRVFPGFWMTKMDDNIRCYSNKTFKEQFVENTTEIQNWVDFMDNETEASAVG